MAEQDLPAVIDKILSETNQPKLYLVGHSLGGTAIFAFLSEEHYDDEKVNSTIQFV